MCSAIDHGYRALFLTLEMSYERVVRRYQAIAAHIDAQYYKIPVPEWPVDIQRRFAAILDPSYRNFGYATFVDMSQRTHSVDDIEAAIYAWREEIDRETGSTDTCRAVYVDWLDKLGNSGLTLTRNTREDVVLVKKNEKLGELARRHAVSMWTATQGTRDAVGREALEMKHTAGAFHKNDPLDISIGFGVVNDPNDAQQENMVYLDDDDEEMPPCNRDMHCSIMKNRDNPTGGFQFYQGPTLRFWDSRHHAGHVQGLLEKGQLQEALNYSGKKTK
jgi:hypothetical protein